MALGGGSVGDASISFKIRVDQLQRDLRTARDATEDAAQKMANSLKRVELQTARLALQQRKLALESQRVAAAEARLAGSLDNVGRAANRSSVGIQALARQFLVLRAALAGIVGVSGVRGITDAADAYLNMSASLQQVTSSAGETAAIQEQLFRIAQRSRSELEGVTNLYVKLKIASDELGISQREVAQFTENFSKVLAISGVDATRASQATFQLTQSFAKQVLQGDELRTIYEAVPPLLRILAEEQGKTTKQIIDDAKSVGISVPLFIDAIVNSTDKINTAFGKLPVTIGGALTQVNNAFIRSVGLSGGATGAFEDLTVAIQNLAITVSSAEFQEGLGLLLEFIATVAQKGADATAGIARVSGEVDKLLDVAGNLRSQGEQFLLGLGIPQETIDSFENVSGLFLTLSTKGPAGALAVIREELVKLGVPLEEVDVSLENVKNSLDDLQTFGLSQDVIGGLGAEGGITMGQLGEVIDEDKRKLERLLGEVNKLDDALGSALGGDRPPIIDEEEAKRLETLADAVTKLKNELALEGIPEDYRQLNSILQGLEINVIATADGVRAIGDATEDELRTAEALLVIYKKILTARQQAALVTTADVRANEEANRRMAQQRAQERKDEAEATAGTEDQARIESASRLPDSIDVANIASQELATTLTDIDNLSFDTLLESFASIAQAISEMIVQALLFQAINAGIAQVFPGSASGQAAAAGASAGGSSAGGAAAPVPTRHGMVLKRMRGGGFITNRPTIIPMADGRAALTSEYGQQEAVLPLKRMASGDMGVAFDGPPGGGGAGNVINIDARQSTPGTVSAAVQAAVRLAPNAVVNAQSRRQIGRGKAPF